MNKKKIIISFVLIVFFMICYKAYICWVYFRDFSLLKSTETSFSNLGIDEDIIKEKYRFDNLPDFIRLYAPKPVKTFYKVTSKTIEDYRKKERYKSDSKKTNYSDGLDDSLDEGISWDNSLEADNDEENDKDFWVAEIKESSSDEKEPSSNLLSGQRLDEYGMPIAASEEIKKENVYFYELIPKDNELYDLKKESNLLAKIDKIIPDNIDDYRSKLIPYINKMIGSKKDKTPLSIENRAKLSEAPNFVKSIREIGIYWILLSKYFEKNNEYDNSLLMSYGIFHILKQYETNYSNTCSFGIKISSILLCNKVCNSILIWASRPKPESIELSKSVAKDILDFVSNEYPLSVLLEEDLYQSNERLNKNYQIKGYRSCLWIQNSEYFKKYIDVFYLRIMEIIDKPVYTAIEFLEKYKLEAEKYYSDYFNNSHGNNNSINYLVYSKFFINPEKFITTLLYQNSSYVFGSYIGLVNINETKKAKMELTAIALAINAYFCENKKCPESMEELSKWFGCELPKNRFTNEVYKLDFGSKHVIYNNGVDGKADLAYDSTDDLYFDFSK